MRCKVKAFSFTLQIFPQLFLKKCDLLCFGAFYPLYFIDKALSISTGWTMLPFLMKSGWSSRPTTCFIKHILSILKKLWLQRYCGKNDSAIPKTYGFAYSARILHFEPHPIEYIWWVLCGLPLIHSWRAVMDFVYLIEILVPIWMSLPYLEPIEPGACFLVFLETAH